MSRWFSAMTFVGAVVMAAPLGAQEIFSENAGASNVCELPRACPPQWYASAYALWLQRDTGNTIVLAEERDPALLQSTTTDSIDFDLQPGLELKIGRQWSSSSGIEATFMGFQDWDQDASLPIDSFNSALSGSPILFVTGNTNPFDNIETNFSSRVYGAEINVSRFMHGTHTSITAGLRYLYFADELRQRSFNGGALLEESEIEASNNLIGIQLGGERSCQWNRLELICNAKAGLLINFNQQEMTNSNQVNTTQFLNVDQEDTSLAGIIEAGLRGRYPITHRFALEGGYRVMVVSGLALAPEQIGLLGNASSNASAVTNANLPGDVNDSGVVILQGVHAGFCLKF